MILSILALTASLLLAILFGLVLKEKRIVALLAAFLSFAAGKTLSILNIKNKYIWDIMLQNSTQIFFSQNKNTYSEIMFLF